MMKSTDETRKRVRAVAWDPRSPATLMIPSATGEMDTFLSHDGVGCNSFETSALMELLDARDVYLQNEDAVAVRTASRAYRKALADCVLGWEAEVTESEQENLELLKIAYAVTHLSETFLLLTPPNDSFLSEYYENTSSLPGAVTADTVRYLRLHHMADPTAQLDDALLDDLEVSLQPDQLDGGEPYWNLVESYVVRGCLQDAWALLSRHSLRRRGAEALTLQTMDEYQAAALAQDQDGFRALEALLMSAPLPGGRTDEFDADFQWDEEEDNDSRQPELLEGVPPSAYRLWESNMSKRGSGDFPVNFQSNAALHVYHSWQQAVKALPEVQLLTRRIPQLSRVLAILSGDLKGVKFESWADELCAELLYKIPNIRLSDVHIRATKIMNKFEVSEEQESVNQMILSIMMGNAGRVVEVLHELGGGSGAALPAVMTSLLCNLLDDAQILPSLSTEYSIQTELLLNAAFAIRSSFATENQSDIGTRLVVRLLLPHIGVDADVRITATLVDALEHHFPATDAEANSLLELCQKLVQRKNIRVLDGCVSIALARYRHFLIDERPGGAVHWLLVGMEYEALCMYGTKRTGNWQQLLATSVCYRVLVTYCMETSEALLKGLLGEGEGVALLYARGKEMLTVCEESDTAGYIAAVKVLENVVSMAEAIAQRKDDALVASGIIACLEERPNDEDDGVVSCLARSSMHWNLIRLAKVILDRNAELETIEEMHPYTASFDVRGMQVLLERLTVMVASLEMEGTTIVSSEEIQQIRLAFAEGLMRAFVAENANKKTAYSKKTLPRASVAGILAADLGTVSREKQELVVQSMLDY